jgi:branched-subunit amino acid transport protein
MRIFFIVLGMFVVTFIPRLLPVFIIDFIRLPGWADRWLRAVPYAALGALVFPGILKVESGMPLMGLAGGLVATILAYYKLHIIYVIFGSIFTVILMKMLFC